MIREHYHRYLGILPLRRDKIPLDLYSRISPHIAPERLHAELQAGNVAVPAIFTKNTYNVLGFKANELSLLFSSRMADELTASRIITAAKFWVEALIFAEKNWKDKLIEPTWDTVFEINLRAPNSPQVLRKAYACLEHFEQEEFNGSRCLFDEIETKAMSITTDPVKASEMLAGGRPLSLFNCSYCGAGIYAAQCEMCRLGHSPAENKFNVLNTALSRKLVSAFRLAGHAFTINPDVTRVKERALRKCL